MNQAARSVLAAFTGIIVAVLIVWGVEALGHVVYAPPADLDFNDAEAMRAFIQTLPPGAFAFVLGGWLLGTLVGGWIAGLIAKRRPLLFAGIVGAVILAGAVFNLLFIPHPTWFSIAAVLGIPAMAWLASRLAQPRS
ncbi:MAG: hypothetical protein R3233_05110 [Xanthomonadales bacterium]|nr:hypothetical protein [Xanthomonadales bacterium]